MLHHSANKPGRPTLRTVKGTAGWKVALCTLLLAASAAAQSDSSSITEPVLGLVFDAQRQAIRSVMGIPAASRLGSSLDAGNNLRAVAISSERGYALAVEEATGAALLITPAGRQPLTGVRAGGTVIAAGPRGTSAAIYFADSGKVSILSGLPENPQVVREVTVDGPPTLLAVSDDGSALAAAVQFSETETSVFTYAADTAGQAVLRARRFVSLEYAPRTTALLMAQDNSVYLYQNRQGLQLVADQRDGLGNVVAASASLSGTRIFIAMRSGQVAIRDLTDDSQTLLSCACEPTGMWRLRGKAVFRLKGPDGGPIWLVDGDAAEPRIVFVAMPAGDPQ